ncbi:MAG: preprotein translocase subunit YajC [Clostridia bacterium]|nr:preprotein translocase subunit YajC [Clostridia bacterium]
MPIGMLVLLGLVFYFLMWRPQKKQQRETDEMRNSVERGDVITTIGGIVGLVIVVKDNDILLETSGDKTRIQIQKWAVRSIEKKSG